MTEVTVLSCGLSVKSKVGGIEGQITGVIIRFDKVLYEITYVSTDQFRVTTMDPGEFDVFDKKHQVIGFTNGKG